VIGAKIRGNMDELEVNVFCRVDRKQQIGGIADRPQKNNTKTQKNNIKH